MENTQRSRGRSRNYKLDRGGSPTDFGAFVGEVMNNIDPTRNGRLQVWIEQFAGADKTNKSLWRNVSYCPPFYGATPFTGTTSGTGGYTPGNQQSYGMWFTPPDLGVQVLCFFAGGAADDGYYIGCIPDQGINHMIPAIGAESNYQTQNKNEQTYYANAPRLPVTEINNSPTNTEISENPQFFKQPKPVHSFVAAVLFQQGLSNDPVRGPIGSSAQRESPSNCYGISTPGRAIYQGGLDEKTIKQKVTTGALGSDSATVIGRRGGHTFVMDDGDLEGKDNLVRIRSSKGHQITMSDDGNCFYICHANGQAWLEFGQEGTLDVFATNSINLRTEGTLNLHADKDVNIFAGEKINIKAKKGFALQCDDELSIACKKAMTIFSEGKLGLKTNVQFAVKSKLATIDGGTALSLKGILISLNGGPTLGVDAPKGITKYVMPDTSFDSSTGWAVAPAGLGSIVTRAPTHEPWPYHNQGVANNVSLEKGQPSPPPGAPPMPPGTSITLTSANAAKVAELKTNLANYKAELVKDEELRAKIIAANDTKLLPEIDQVIADRKKVIAVTEQQIATLERGSK
jgi:hypothetical protein